MTAPLTAARTQFVAFVVYVQFPEHGLHVADARAEVVSGLFHAVVGHGADFADDFWESFFVW